MRRFTLCAAALAAVTACSDSTGPDAAAELPAQAEFVVSDIGHFWEAYDAGGRAGSTGSFQTHYLDRASPGLRDFIQARSVTALSLAQMVTAYPRYFAAIRENTLRLTPGSPVLTQIRENYATIEALYPAAAYPPVTFLIGRFSTGGTIRQSGMLIGVEFYASDDTTPTSELGTFQRINVKPLDSIPAIVAHEHVHVMQARAGGTFGRPGSTLLEQSLMEGSADFVGELASGAHVNGHVYEYGLAHEGELWAEFQLAMNGTNVSQWLYNQGNATGARPGDLGYFVGYRISQAFYLAQADKTAALRQIIEMRNAAAFLAASGYDGQPP